MLDMFHFVAFPYSLYSQSCEASNTKGWDLEKWVRASLTSRNLVPRVFLFSNMAPAWSLGSELNEAHCVSVYKIHSLLWWKESNLSPQISALASLFWLLQGQKVSYLYITFKLVKSVLSGE